MNDTTTAVRKPRFAYHETRPAGGIYFTEWAIERQLSLASDYDETDLVDVLRAMNPDVDESIAADIEQLLDLADQVADAESHIAADNDWRLARDVVVDEYVDHLRKLAHLITHTKNYAPVRRPRHTLGATS